jgi:hypothetical protein
MCARRIRLSASRADVALSKRLLGSQKTACLSFSDVFEASGCVALGRDRYLRLKDGRGYVLSHDAGMALVGTVEPQRGLWMYKVAYEGGIGLRHVASYASAHRVAPPDAQQHPAVLPHGTAVECDARVIKRLGEQLVAFARLSDGSGWIFSHAGAVPLLELIAFDYQGTATDHAARAARPRRAPRAHAPTNCSHACTSRSPRAGGEADEDAARALQQQLDALEAAPAPREELEAITALADDFPEPQAELEASAPEPLSTASPARVPLQQRSVNMVSASPSPGSASLRALAPCARAEQSAPCGRAGAPHQLTPRAPATTLLSAATGRAAIEKVKVASANQHAAHQYSMVDDVEQIAVVGAVSTLNRLWPTAHSA